MAKTRPFINKWHLPPPLEEAFQLNGLNAVDSSVSFDKHYGFIKISNNYGSHVSIEFYFGDKVCPRPRISFGWWQEDSVLEIAAESILVALGASFVNPYFSHCFISDSYQSLMESYEFCGEHGYPVLSVSGLSNLGCTRSQMSRAFLAAAVPFSITGRLPNSRVFVAITRTNTNSSRTRRVYLKERRRLMNFLKGCGCENSCPKFGSIRRAK
jgi:hypothetical protein